MAVVNLGLFFGYLHTNYYTVPVLIIAKLYSNALLVIFNSCMHIAGGREEYSSVMTPDLDFMTHLEVETGAQEQVLTSVQPQSAYLDEWERREPGGMEAIVHRSVTMSSFCIGEYNVLSCCQWWREVALQEN
jgi:hypothetical protein